MRLPSFIAGIGLALLPGCHTQGPTAPGTPVSAVRPPPTHAPRLVPQLGHGGAITQLTWLDARRLVTAGVDGSVRLWDVQSGVLLASAYHGGRITALVHLPESNELLSASHHETVVRWDAQTLTRRSSMDVSTTLVGMARDDAGDIWGVGADKTLLQMSRSAVLSRRSSDGEAIAVAFDFDHGRLFVADPTNDAIEEFDLAAFKRRRNLLGEERINDIALSPNGRLASCGTGDTIHLWDLERGTIEHTLRARGNEIESVSFSPDGSSLLAAMPVGVSRFDLQAGEETQVFRNDDASVPFVSAFSPEGTSIAWGDTAALHVIDTHSGTQTLSSHERLPPIVDLVFGGEALHSLDASGKPTTWHLDEVRAEAHAAPPLRGTAAALAVNPSGRFRIATIGEAATVFEFGEVMPPGHRASHAAARANTVLFANATELDWSGQGFRGAAPVTAVALSDDGQAACFGDGDGHVYGWTRGGTPSERYRHATPVTACAVTEDTVASASQDGEVQVSGPGVAKQWSVAAPALALALDDRARSLAIGAGGTAHVVHTHEASPSYRDDGHAAVVTSVAFSKDGRLASGAADGTVRLHRGDEGSWHFVAAGASRAGQWVLADGQANFAASAAATDLAVVVRAHVPYRLEQVARQFNRPDILLEALGSADAELQAHVRERVAGRRSRAALPTVQIESASALHQENHVSVEGIANVAATEVRVFVNGVPVAVHPRLNAERFAFEVPLGAGRNTMEYALVGPDGVESARRSAVFDSLQSVRNRTAYVLAIGVSDYRDDQLDLAFADADARAVSALFEGVGDTSAVPHVKTRVITNAQATAEGIHAASSFFAEADVDDLVVLFVAEHGTYVEDDYVFLPHDADPSALKRTGVRYDDLLALVGTSPSRHRFVLLDTCESGDRPSGPARSTLATVGARPRTTRGLVYKADAPPRARRIFRRDRFLYTDLDRKTGAVVMSAAQGDEASLEFEALGHGVFTWALGIAMRDRATDLDRNGTASPDEILIRVAALVRERTEGLQNPTIDRHNRSVELEFPVRTR